MSHAGPADATRQDPPRGAPWDLPLADAVFAAVDFETTGPDPSRDEIVEAGVVRWRAGVVLDRFSTRVRPTIPVGVGAVAVHGIDDRALTDAPPFADVRAALDARLVDTVPVMHGARLDVAVAARAWQSVGAASPLGFHLDTLELSRRVFGLRRHALPAVCAALGLPGHRWHRAVEDAEATVELLARLVPALDATTPRDLWQVRAGQHGPVRVRDALAAVLEALARAREPVQIVLRARGTPERRIACTVLDWSTPFVTVARQGIADDAWRIRADRILRIERHTPSRRT